MDPRDELTAYLRGQLMGPADGEREVLLFPPDRQYLVGTLYPRDADLHGQLRLVGDMDDEDEGRGTEEAREDTNPAVDPLPSVNSWLPSSLGISFYTDATELQVTCSAARYLTEQGERARQWRREPLPEETIPLGPKDDNPKKVFDGRGELTVHWRPFSEGHLVTVGLANAVRAGDEDSRTPAWDRMLFQACLGVTVPGGRIRQYPSITLISRDEEEQELRLQYRHVRTYAIGHGCAVGEVLADGRVVGLKTELLPHVDVPDVRAAGPTDLPVLRLARLADDQVAVGDLREELRAFAAAIGPGTRSSAVSTSRLGDVRPPTASWPGSRPPSRASSRASRRSAIRGARRSSRPSGSRTGPWRSRCDTVHAIRPVSAGNAARPYSSSPTPIRKRRGVPSSWPSSCWRWTARWIPATPTGTPST